ncbi:AI-2E family transporter [Egicoccus sp. AB-alg2]|uniref:AI-2E family transporter n=1 Tax=Egicoccus sp. AB-alg2 TaxID=3242693 RepID=UPI00359DE517
MSAPVREQDLVPSWLATAAAWTWRLLLLVLGAAVFVQVATRLSLVTVPLIVALILATLASPPARWLMRRGWRPAFASFLVVFGGVAVAVTGLLALVPTFIEQTRELIPTVLIALQDLLDWLETGPLGFEQAQLQALGEQVLAQAEEQQGPLAIGALAVLATTLEFLAALILAVILLFFLVKDGERIWAWFLARAPDVHRDTLQALGARAWDASAGYVRGTALVALIDAVGIGIGLAIVGVPLVLPLTVLVFIGGFVPIVGAFVSGLVAVLVALADGGAGTALIVLLIVVVVQQVESDLLQPLIMRRAVPLHPMVVLAVLIAGTVLVGVVGAFLAVPLAAVASAVTNELRLRHQTDVGGPHPLGGRRGHLDEDPAPVVVQRPDEPRPEVLDAPSDRA